MYRQPTVPGPESGGTVLNTCSIVRKFLNDEVPLSDEEADNP